MQFKNIIAFVSLAVMATALPAENLVPRTTPGQGIQDQCTSTQTAKCCNAVTQKVFGLITVPVGIGCVDLDLVSVLPLGSQCSQSSKVACCSSGDQYGLINVANVCPQVF